jgi:3-oxoacyl-[acyl-carrier-protein] synthase-3
MIGIKGISYHLPKLSIDNKIQAQKFKLSNEFIEKRIGAWNLPIKKQSQETSDLAIEAITALKKEYVIDMDIIQAIVLITQNPDMRGLPHTAAIIHEKLSLKNDVAAFDISLGCSGYVYGLSIVKGLMNEAGLSNAILITCDPYSKVIDRESHDCSLLFGDASSATWLSIKGDWIFNKPLLSTDGSGHRDLYVNNNNILNMNGRRIFNFAKKEVPKQINQILINNNLDPNQIDLFCLHQGSKAIINEISKLYPQQKTKFLNDIQFTGNTVSSSIPILLKKNVLKSKAKTVLISGFGVGLSWGTNILFKKDV